MAMFDYGRAMSATDLLNALDTFHEISRTVSDFFTRYDLFVTPNSSEPPQRIGAFECDIDGPIDLEDWNRESYRHDAFYPLYNTTGQPAISLPLHESSDGLPIGIQFAAGMGREDLLIQIASFFEQTLPWSERRPQIHVAIA